MLKQYSILTSCLSELKTSSMPTVEKLKLEIQLIQTKRILFDHEVEHRVAGDESSETEFRDLYCLVRRVSSSCDASGEISSVTAQLQKIRDGLNSKICTVSNAIESKLMQSIAKKLFRNGTF